MKNNNYVVPVAIVVAGIIVSVGLYFGLKEPKSEAAAFEPTPKANTNTKTQVVKTSIDDDPILGDKDSARVAIVEFSDYECPFCKRFRDTTMDQIVKNYIDTGEVILVFRDLPLAFHEPAASREAQAAECVQEFGGDSKYFEFHDKIFETSPGNGAGISVEDLGKLAAEVGVDASQVVNCINDKTFADEVKNDARDAAKVGIRGTPGFVIGKLSSDGSVEGEVISGARPYPDFKTAIEKYLN